MKFTFTLFSFFLFTTSFAQVPSEGLVFVANFSDSFLPVLPSGMQFISNTGSLGSDGQALSDNAFQVDPGEAIVFDNFSNNLQVGATNAEVSVSLKFRGDIEFISAMNDGSYASIFNSGDVFIRILKSNTYYLQVGLFNGNSGSDFGFIFLNYEVNVDMLASWTTVSLAYAGQSPSGQVLNLFYNGSLVQSINQDLETEMNGGVSYTNNFMVLGSLAEQAFSGTIDEVFIHNRFINSVDALQIYYSQNFVGTTEVSQNDEFALFPNPTAEDLTIFYPFPMGVAHVYSATGKWVASTTLLKGNNKLTTSSLAPGAYFIKTNGKVQRFMKQ